MRAICVAVLLTALLTISLRADTREVTKITVAGHETIFATYVQGNAMRTEHLSQNSSRQLVMIDRLDRKVRYILDVPARKYVEQQSQAPDLILSLAQWIARPPRNRDSGKTVNLYYETVDTGERKQFFGRTAKHLLLRERHVAEPGACNHTYDMERNGWYLPLAEPDTAQASYHLVGHIAFSDRAGCGDTVVKHGIPPSPGFPVLETNGSMTREILDLSYEPLDKTLFEVPSGFQKVDALPGYPQMSWSAYLEMEWMQLERAFESWFE